MRKITICIQYDALLFKYRTNKTTNINLLNTTVITNNELVFSEEYIKENKKIVSSFLADIFKEKEIRNVIISSISMFDMITDLLKGIKEINCITLKEDVVLPYNICEKIINLGNIKKLNCYSIPTFLIELLDKNNIICDVRNEMLFTSNFTLSNKLDSLTKIYYCDSIRFNDFITDDDLDDINSFFKINKYLKKVIIDKFSTTLLQKVSDIIIEQKRKNITIEIHEDINDPDDIFWLRNFNKDLKEKYKIKLSLVYSKDYLEKNYLKQVVFSTLKMCAILAFLIVTSVIGYITLNNYQSEKKVEHITDELKEIMVDDTTQSSSSSEEIKTSDIANYKALLTVNPDTIGWLTVNNTNIDYPVVQTTDNEYYLNRNFYGDKDFNGWVFMDYRNNKDDLDDNTIVYAHNRYYSGVMFGTLSKVTRKEWYSNPDNLTITFNTLGQKMTWKVFSIYSLDVTNDYLLINFDTEEEHQTFIDMIKNRSNVKLDTQPTTKDKILTLSTCLDNNRRLVVHSILITDKDS